MSGSHPLWAAGVTESLGALLRGHLAANPGAREALRPLAGRLIALRLDPSGRTLYLCPTNEDIQILTEISGQPDVTLDGNLGAYLRAIPGGSATDLNAAGLTLTGDGDVALAFQRLALAMPIDWPRFLSRWVGQRLAGLLVEFGRGGRVWTQDALTSLEADVSEYLREEVHWLPDQSETEVFNAEVDRLRDDVERLALRIERIQRHIGPGPRDPVPSGPA